MNENEDQGHDVSMLADNGEEWSWEESLEDLSDLPSSIIVSNVPSSVFQELEVRKELESLFTPKKKSQDSDSGPRFEYFKSFKRIRISYNSPQEATAARIQCDRCLFRGVELKCFFAQTSDEWTSRGDDSHLALPPLEKQFLISPPASPPVGWEQGKDAEPVINFDLVARLAALAPADVTHEIHAGSQNCPAIVVHTCEDSRENQTMGIFSKIKIPHTPCPPKRAFPSDSH